MTITLNLNEETVGLLESMLENMLEEEILTSSRMSGPDCQQARALLADLHSVCRASYYDCQPTLLHHDPSPLFVTDVVPEADTDEIISRYSREDALADGTLIDVTDMAREVGYDIPVALTRELAADVAAIPDKYACGQDETGRKWDLLYVGFLNMKKLLAKNKRLQAENKPLQMETVYTMEMPVGDSKVYSVQLTFTVEEGHDRPVITLGRPGQD